jgi:beta-lactamase superfamily II metal-dependent hydrolase
MAAMSALRTLRAAVTASCLCLMVFLPEAFAGLEIHCLDVGQGDCTLIISSTGGTFLPL